MWIDFDDNCIFDAFENVAYRALSSTYDTSVTVTIPEIGLGATTGAHRMRATVAYMSTPDPCSSSNTYGETHDYTVNILTYTCKSFRFYIKLATIPTPPCTPVAVGSSSVLFSTSSLITSYTCKAYSWTSNKTGNIALAFQLRDDPDYWYVDDVSVYNGGVQMLVNGGFESGFLSPGWIRTTPNGVCSGPGGTVSSISPRTGSYCLRDGYIGCADQISQSFAVTAGQLYVVSFWIQAGGSGAGTSASVTIS
ncbi:unnamed protein product [Rotaria sp. Silwood2]|nr:unnamed protein product [Rotaria sp. Silwood2]